MRLILIYVIYIVFNYHPIHAQTRVARPVKPEKKHPSKSNLSFGVGLNRSVLFLTRNVKENNDANGNTFHLTYDISRIMRASIEYTQYRPINIEPTWYDIKANSIEANVHFLAKFKNTKALFYPMAGISYNHFSGYFTGRNDFMGLSKKYPTNSVVVTNWVGINVGTGYEHFIGPVSFFMDYKMRVGYNNGKNYELNIMDVCFGLGIKYNLKVPSIYKIVSGTKNRYFLDAE